MDHYSLVIITVLYARISNNYTFLIKNTVQFANIAVSFN